MKPPLDRVLVRETEPSGICVRQYKDVGVQLINLRTNQAMLLTLKDTVKLVKLLAPNIKYMEKIHGARKKKSRRGGRSRSPKG